MLEAVFFNRNFSPRPQPWHRFTPTRCTWSALGGPSRATLQAQRPAPFDLSELAGLLRCPLELWTPGGARAWWGLVYAVRITDGAAGLSFSLDSLSNRVRARYYEPDPNQFTGGTLLWTGWAEELLSQSIYGIKERQVVTTNPDGIDSTDATQAARLRDSVLSGITGPKGAPFWLSRPGSLSIELECRGWFETLDWRFYEQPAGLVANTPNVSGVAQDLGTAAQPYAAQSFSTGATGWRLDQVWVSLKQVGALADALVCQLVADSGGTPGSGLATCQALAGSTLPLNFSWKKLTFNDPYYLAANTPYWLYFFRSGALDNTNFYRLQVDESLAFSGGVFKYHNGSAWVNRAPNADLLFRASGAMPNAVQIALTTANPGGGQFLTGPRWDATTPIYSNPHRPGLLTCQAELLQLLTAGNAAGSLLAEVTPERVLVIRQKPGSANPRFVIGSDGFIKLRGGAKAPPSSGIAGEWAALDASWSNTPSGLALAPGRVFLDAVQWTPAGVSPVSAQ